MDCAWYCPIRDGFYCCISCNVSDGCKDACNTEDAECCPILLEKIGGEEK